MDCTYKLNKHKMPLFDIVGMAYTGQTFYARFAFLYDKQTESYTFVLDSLRGIFEAEDIQIPKM